MDGMAVVTALVQVDEASLGYQDLKSYGSEWLDTWGDEVLVVEQGRVCDKNGGSHPQEKEI